MGASIARRIYRKRRVDECAWVLCVEGFRDELRDGVNPVTVTIDWEADTAQEDGCRPFCTVHPGDGAGEVPPTTPDRERVRFLPFPWPVYGVRWFMACPRCQRRCGRLYAPQRHQGFACRACHRLTYWSAAKWDNEARTGYPAGLWGRMIRAMERGDDPYQVLRSVRAPAAR